MSVVHARQALLPEGWQVNVRIGLEAERIASVDVGVPAQAGDERHAVALPGLPNLHSHSFQRGMAGLTELRGPTQDTFWSWRELMYRFALEMTPDQLEAVASQLYVEMLEAGFTRVGEFHYLHHDRDGRPYTDPAELAGRITAAASQTGIGLTLLPVFYAHGTFGGAPATAGQRRFISDPESFVTLLERCRAIARQLEGTVVGVAPHSLRAVTPSELELIAKMAPQGPIHIHAAEQVREVEDCLDWSGQRPVEWLLDHAGIDQRWCLIHATHMTEEETARLARSGAVAGLCPVTEANLGDGIFNAPSFVAAGGRLGIGSDSNILIGVTDELRQLEYAQRLRQRARNVMAPAGGSTGRALFDAALAGGSQALGAPGDGLAAGAPADIVTLDPGLLPPMEGDRVLDAWIFADGASVDSVWVRGRRLVSGGRHHAREAVARRFTAVLRELLAA